MTRRSGSFTGSGRSNRLSTREKMAVFAPMPKVSERTATAVTIGVARRERTARRRSFTRPPGSRMSVLIDERERVSGPDVHASRAAEAVALLFLWTLRGIHLSDVRLLQLGELRAKNAAR